MVVDLGLLVLLEVEEVGEDEEDGDAELDG